jgi:acetolactate decarboxylase
VLGYHFHLLSKDRTKDGHVLACSGGELRVGMQTVYEFEVRLPTEGSFLQKDLSGDTAADLKKAG